MWFANQYMNINKWQKAIEGLLVYHMLLDFEIYIAVCGKHTLLVTIDGHISNQAFRLIPKKSILLKS